MTMYRRAWAEASAIAWKKIIVQWNLSSIMNMFEVVSFVPSLSFVGRFVLAGSVLYWRFHEL